MSKSRKLTWDPDDPKDVKRARQELKKARTDLGYSIIKAPFDGTIGISQVKVGNTVNTGQTVMNTISTDDPMAVDFVINGLEKGTLKPVIDRVFPFDQIVEAHRYLETSGQFGKIVVAI